LRHARPQHRRGAAAAGGSSGSLSFSSQFGTFTVESLPVVGGQGDPGAQAPAQNNWQPPQQQAPQSQDEILSALERLGALHQKGVLSDQEFASKKAELPSRI
jgi:Short C-terminal domain